ncbi:MAG: hypothetical protein MI862_04670 [Desulfobacterales bacterium]|nr:hypothetical protein [Desulfobacterales bacterium]
MGPVSPNLDYFTELFNTYTGQSYSKERLYAFGENIIKEEARFNEKAGISKYQNDLPEFFKTEELHSGLVFDVDTDKMRNIFQ